MREKKKKPCENSKQMSRRVARVRCALVVRKNAGAEERFSTKPNSTVRLHTAARVASPDVRYCLVMLRARVL